MASTSSPPSLFPQHNVLKTKTSFPAPKPFRTNLSFSTKSIRAAQSCSSTDKYSYMVDEEMDRIRRLQNGSDVRRVAVQGEKGREVDMTPPAVEAIAESFGEWVIDALEKERGTSVQHVKVSLGRDPRISGSSLSVAVFAGTGKDVVHLVREDVKCYVCNILFDILCVAELKSFLNKKIDCD